MQDNADGPSAKLTHNDAPMSSRRRRAERLHQQGLDAARADRWREALHAFRDAAAIEPRLPHLHFRLGVALCRADQFDAAIDAFHQELLIAPDHGPALTEIGTCLARTGRTEQGIGYLERGLRVFPNQPRAQFSLGLALLTQNRRPDAIAALERALAMDASYADVYRTRALAYVMGGEFERAVEDLHAAVALSRDNSRAIIDLGVMFGRAEQSQQAGRLFETAAKVSPDLALAQFYYGQFLINQKQFQRGLDYIDRALALDPHHAESHVSRGFGLMGQGRVDDAVVAFRRAGKLKPDDAFTAGTLLFALQHKPGVTERELLVEHRRWGRLYRRGLPHDRLQFDNDANPGRLPRLGIVSADLHRHAAMFLTLPAFEQLARLGFPIACYQTDSKRPDDDFSDRLKSIAFKWSDISKLDDDAAIEQIMTDHIDILFDLSGHTAGNRLGIFERRAAPIQLSWAGYVGTVGMDTYEGLIADAVEVPPGNDRFYLEPVIRMPDCYVSYQPPVEAPLVTALPALSSETFTFGCFNRPAKLNAAVAATWARILARVPQGRIRMMYGGLDENSTRQALVDTFKRGGLDPERVELIGETQQANLLIAYNDIDLALDPFPYSGGVTTLEAMWMGVPVITMVGDTFAGRHSASHLTAAGLASFCTASTDAYVDLAVSWSENRAALGVLRSTLRDRVRASPLCDAPRFASHLAGELNRLWTDWCRARRH